MGFLNALLLAGTATFAIPVVIHLIFKLRKRRLVFSSLRFLQQSLLRESKRLRLRDLILLLLRCAACILIALAFARPYRAGQVLAGPTGELREDLVLVLDDTPSMAAQDGAATRWQAAQEQALEAAAAENLERLGLVLVGEPGRPEVELSRNFEATREALKKRARPSYARGQPAQALITALDLLADSSAPRRRVLYIGDLQLNQVDRAAFGEAANRAVSGARPTQVELRPPAFGKPPGKLNNFSVESVQARSDVWIEGRPVRFAARVANHGDGEAGALVVKLVSGDKVLAQRTVGLGPHDAREFELQASFPRPGEVHGYVAIEPKDALPDDDRRLFALKLRSSIRTLVVEDSLLERNSYNDESYYVRMGLDPRPRGAEEPEPGQGGGYVRVGALAVKDLTPAALKDCDVLFLAGVTELPAATLATLEESVRKGLNLVVFLGRAKGEISEGFYSGPFWKNGEGLLPARPGTRFLGDLLEKKYDGLDTFAADHPVFQAFKGEVEQELRRPQFLRHYQPDPKDLKAGSRPAGQILASFNDGSPLLVERPFGQGLVMMFSFCARAEDDTTDLPKRKIWVPLLHQVVRYLSGVDQGAQRNLTVGDDLALSTLGIEPTTTVRLTRPAPHSDTLELAGSEVVSVDTIGIYTGAYQPGALVQQAHWAANLDPLESDLKSEDLAAVQGLFASNLSGDKEDEGPRLRHQADDELKAQAPDWRYLLVAALVCLLLEVGLRDFWGD
ncbi:MAG: BatA and WFA domain-containing protein [Planctomycetota bacterium]|nr:BatA and WFA domain-containing protein [Planctomycetota bacterium]